MRGRFPFFAVPQTTTPRECAASSADCLQESTLSGLAASRTRCAAAGAAGATHGRSVFAHCEIDRAEVSTAVCAIRFTTGTTSRAIGVYGTAGLSALLSGALRQI